MIRTPLNPHRSPQTPQSSLDAFALDALELDRAGLVLKGRDVTEGQGLCARMQVRPLSAG